PVAARGAARRVVGTSRRGGDRGPRGVIRSAVDQEAIPLAAPGLLVGRGERLEVRGGRGPVLDPFAQRRSAVDHVDREARLVLVGEVAPQLVVAVLRLQRLE